MILADSKGPLRTDNCYQSPRQSEILFILCEVNFWKISRLEVWSKLDLKVQNFLEGSEMFFPHKSYILVVYKPIFAHRVCALKGELRLVSIHSIYFTFFHLFAKTYFEANTHFRSKYPLSVFVDKLSIFNLYAMIWWQLVTSEGLSKR